MITAKTSMRRNSVKKVWTIWLCSLFAALLLTLMPPVATNSFAAETNDSSDSVTLDGARALAGTKTLTGRNWKDADRFVFELRATSASPDAPMPQNTVGGVTPTKGTAYVELSHKAGKTSGNPEGFSFSDIEYSKPGTYTYELRESEEASNSLRTQDGGGIQPGVSVSHAAYRIIVQVSKDKDNGALRAKSTMTKLADDEGNRFSNAKTVESADFVNTFNTEETKWSPKGTMSYKDTTGAHGLTQGMLNVALCTDDSAAPLPSGDGAKTFEYESDGKTWRGIVTSVSESGLISFPKATYGFNEEGEDFTYRIVEVVKGANGKWVAVKNALQNSDHQLNGMKYDPSVWMVKVSAQDRKGAIDLKVQYFKDGVSQGDTQTFSFENTYEPTAAKATISGTKKLTGRDMLEGESFGFDLQAVNDAAKNVLPDGKQATVTGLKDGVGKTFDFGKLSFTKPGTYTFSVSESKYAGSADKLKDGIAGITFDHHKCVVTVTVTDDGNGTLSATTDADASDLTFENVYRPQATSATICASKTLTGGTLKNNQFTFLLTSTDNEEVQAKNTADGTVAFPELTFDEPGTYKYTLTELNDEQDNVTYDDRSYQVTITVVDDLQGHLDATVDSDKKTLVFENTYNEPSMPEQAADTTPTPSEKQGADTVQVANEERASGDEIPSTGDDTTPLPLIATAILAGIVVIATEYVMHRRQSR